MCYAIPAKIISIKDDNAQVDYGGIRKLVNIILIPDAKIDDFILIHAGFAIEKLERSSAEKTIKLIKEDLAKAMIETEKEDGKY